MKKKYNYLIILILFSSCNSFSDDFFDFLFNTHDISLNRECSDNPSVFSEGKSFEIYSLSKANITLAIQGILRKPHSISNDKYRRYKLPEWHITPIINHNDSTYAFIHSEMSGKENKCFDKNALIKLLQQEKNYYTFLYDNLGRVKLFILDTNNKKLFLLTSYEL